MQSKDGGNRIKPFNGNLPGKRITAYHMYKTATFFIKAQIPQATIPVLIDLFVQELEYQKVNEIAVDGNSIQFSNKPFKNLYGNKFSDFSSGQIVIEDTGPEYIVSLQGDPSELFIRISGFIGAFTFLVFILSGFEIVFLFFGLIVFIIVEGIVLLLRIISFPVYFTSLRNDIERLLQNDMRQ
jgi:hypothetical protein